MSDLQRQASDPEYSVWVAASAGTGKTKILTDRVLRLLIKGAEFKNILCLTFTNAAALEMQTRISNKLRNFALADVSKLEEELFLITGEKPLASEIANAQTLYPRLLNTDAPLNIYTIHAFCQRILKSFPLEAGVTPEFQILDDSLLQDIFLKIKSEIYLNPTHHSLINFLLSNFHETTIQDIFDEIITQKIKFKKLFTLESREVNNELSAAKQLSHMYDNIKSLLAKYSLNISPKELFFTKDGSKRKSIFSKELQKQYLKLLVELENISTEIYRLDQLSKAEEITYYSTLLINLAQIFLKKYEQYKLDNNFLDYDDLIYYTKLLLSNDNIEWVLHKLEGEIHHILIDEAQDTAPDQWAIISAIITEFNTSAKSNSSIFVVGDEKQSIFSFQGANLTIFNNINNVLKDNLAKANKKFKNITLEWSYRSTEEILQVVHKVLKQIKIDNSSLFISDNPLISSFRRVNKSHNGSVELWPLVVADKKEELFWSLPEEYNKSLSSAELLIEKITDFIKDQIKSKRILPSTGQEITPKDFMILVRKRDDFSNGLINHLKQSGLKVEGSDRVTLKENLSVMDLTSIAKFVLLPDDDLNLASLLKSPIIGMSEGQLYELALSRKDCSLWAALFDNILLYKNIYEKLSYLIEIYQTSNAGNFFISVINNLNLREILNTANGADSDDAINELLSLSADYAHKIDNSLQGFIAWFENNDIKIKRDIEHSDKIRIMTVHGSKGLQSPIVILCDNTIMPINKNKFIWTEEGEVFFSTQTSNSPDFFKDLKEQEQQKDIQEYIRLLYVAMTRAEDHLIICGYSNKAKIPENCWYQLVAKSIIVV
ncbi:UvrD-helicase domain-containing protein [Rickettsia endosymbiont of Polydrusus tereticollis]|uniref:UvrD-helicase domain-containing protein n=1 Tax=Rickettsia endosymbiont of Polydrusus tereticollis TaxID=3066251 RepID=UPI003132E7AF